MRSALALLSVIVLALVIVQFIFIRKADANQTEMRSAVEQFVQLNGELVKVREQLKKDEGLLPDQAAVMTHVGYHFTNLWFAVDQENWALADFYLGEARANIKWAVRAKPIRKGLNGDDVDLGAIAQALDNTNLTALKKAIETKQKTQFATLYNETLSVCYACHKASGKPYLRPQVPQQPEIRIINMDPNAKSPQ